MNRVRVGEQGQALVELAFVIPLVLLFLFAIIDFGLALNASNTDTNIANLAARQASLVTTANTECPNGSTPSSFTAWVDCENAPNSPSVATACIITTSYQVGYPITVRVTRNFSWTAIVGGLGSDLSALDSTLTSSATMRIEQVPSSGSSPFPSGSSC